MESLNGVVEKQEMPIIVNTHSRTRNIIETKNIEINDGMGKYIAENSIIKLIKSDKKSRVLI